MTQTFSSQPIPGNRSLAGSFAIAAKHTANEAKADRFRFAFGGEFYSKKFPGKCAKVLTQRTVLLQKVDRFEFASFRTPVTGKILKKLAGKLRMFTTHRRESNVSKTDHSGQKTAVCITPVVYCFCSQNHWPLPKKADRFGFAPFPTQNRQTPQKIAG